MKTEDLKLNNLVYGVSDRIEMVVILTENEVGTWPYRMPKRRWQEHGELLSIDDITPIDFDDKWADAFGFMPDEDEPYSWSLLTSGHDKDRLLTIYKKPNEQGFWFRTKISYVHEFQNIFYAIHHCEPVLIKSL